MKARLGIAVERVGFRKRFGLGLEKAIPDNVAGTILDEHIIPLFKQNRYADGIIAGVEAVIIQLDQANQATDHIRGTSAE